MEWAFADSGYLEVDGGQIAIALAALVRVTRGEVPAPTEIEASQLESFAAQPSPERLAWIQAQLDRALSGKDSSEVRELWEETDDFSKWLQSSCASVSP